MTPEEFPVLNEAFLAHFGVKGMKWGRRRKRRRGREITSGKPRRFDTQDRINRARARTKDSAKRVRDESSRRASSIKRAMRKNSTDAEAGPVLNTVLAGMDAVTDILRKAANARFVDGYKHSGTMVRGEAAVNKLLTKFGDRYREEITLPETTSFRRMSNNKEAEVRDGTYVTYKPEDNVLYSTSWVAKYGIDIRPKGPVKFPSLKTRFDTMVELVDEKPKGGGKTVRQLLATQEKTVKGKLWVKTASAEELGKYAYGSKVGITWENDEIGKRFINRLRDKGYDAMNDDMDSGTIDLANNATVLINKDKFEVRSATERTVDDWNKDYDEFEEYSRRGMIIRDNG